MEPSYSIQQLHEQEIVRNQEITNQQQGEIDKQKAETEISAEFWNASPLTKTEHDEDIGMLEQVTPQQWDAIRDLKAGLAPSNEDAIQLKMLSREQRRAILEIARWLTWKDGWLAEKNAEIRVNYYNLQQETLKQEELNILKFQAFEASRPRTTNCYKDLFGGFSCTQF